MKILLILETIKKTNYLVNLDKKKLQYFSKVISNGSKPYWVKYKLYFTNKHIKSDAVIDLSRNGELVLKNKQILNNFSYHFGTLVDKLRLDHWEDYFLCSSHCFDSNKNIIKKAIKNRPSIAVSKENKKVFVVPL